MGASNCPGCKERDARITEWERQLAELTARLKINSSNSSTPPWQNPLNALKPVTKKKSTRPRGGQPGHPPHGKQLLLPERGTRVEHVRPDTCAKCRAALLRGRGFEREKSRGNNWRSGSSRSGVV
jgi:hypothetical protein